MSLVKVYNESGIPAIIGDVLVTSKVNKLHQIFNKKIYIISPNLAVGWVNDKLPAKIILRGLYEKFRDKKVSKDELENFFLSSENSGNYYAKINGLIIDDVSYGFTFFTNAPEQSFNLTEFPHGSGSDFYNFLFSDEERSIDFSKRVSKIDEELSHLLAEASSLLAGDVFDSNKEDDFGLGYEVIYFDGNKFKYLDDVLHLYFGITVDTKNKKIISITALPKCVKYKNFNSFSVIQTFGIKGTKPLILHNNQIQVFDNSPSKWTRNFVTSILDNRPDEKRMNALIDIHSLAGKGINLKSNYYTITFGVEHLGEEGLSILVAYFNDSYSYLKPFRILRLGNSEKLEINLSGVISYFQQFVLKKFLEKTESYYK